MNWAAEEFKTLNLDDTRLNARAVLLAERLSNKPTESIPGACHDNSHNIGILLCSQEVSTHFCHHVGIEKIAFRPVNSDRCEGEVNV